MKSATKKQVELIKEMYWVLSNEMDFGKIGKKSSYNIMEASKLIKLNKDMYFVIENEGQCTVRQYEKLSKIAGRKPKLDRYLIGFTTANEWIAKYSKVI